jgi:hypothetical protein
MRYEPTDPDHFLNALPISEQACRKLAELSPKSAFDLLARRRAAPAAFDAHVGADEAEAVAQALNAALTDEQRAALAAPLSAAPRRLGARMEPPPTPRNR